jgi:uncharacterized protein (DUF2336 family)
MGDVAAVIGDLGARVERASPAERDGMLAELGDLFAGMGQAIARDGLDTFDAVFVSLMATCSVSARARLSERLAPVERGPQRAILRLAFDDNIMVARPVLRLSPLLLDEQLLAIATVKSPEHLLAICDRKEIGAPVTDVILSRADGDITIALASNPGARFSAAGQERLMAQALDDGELYDILIERSDLAEKVRRLDLGADADARTRVMACLDAGRTDDALAEVAAELGVAAGPVFKAFKVDMFGGFLAYAKAARLDWNTVRLFANLRFNGGALVPQLKRAEAEYAELTVAEARRVVDMLAAHGARSQG